MADFDVTPMRHTAEGELPDTSVVSQLAGRLEQEASASREAKTPLARLLYPALLLVGAGASLYYFWNRFRARTEKPSDEVSDFQEIA